MEYQLKLPHDQSAARSCAVCCDVAADATVRAGLEALPELRRHPGTRGGEALPACFLKHADEQTVVGLAAVFKAMSDAGMAATDFRDWGVVAAPRFLGRPAMAAALQRFQSEGAWGVSPHLIPHRSLHSISGTVSQTLKIHGPNFGVGGGPGGVAEVLLTAAALLEGKKLPGVWVVLTCLDPELPPAPDGHVEPATQFVGLALALTPLSMVRPRLRLRVVSGSAESRSLPPKDVPATSGAGFDLPRLETLLALLHSQRGGDTTIVQLLEPGSRIELSALRTPLPAVRYPLSPTGECGQFRADSMPRHAEGGQRVAEMIP